jgi:RNA polymerase sigma-B factor
MCRNNQGLFGVEERHRSAKLCQWCPGLCNGQQGRLLVASLHALSVQAVDDSAGEVLLTAIVPKRRAHQVPAVRPGDPAATAEVDGWLWDYASSRDPELRERIILAYLGLADRLAARYRSSRGTSPEDLTQTARAALIAAIDRYDPTRNLSFVPFAVACVVGELKRHLRDTSWRLHVPRPLKEQALLVCKAADRLQQTLGRAPTIRELAHNLRMEEEQVLEALAAATTRHELSLDRPVGDDTDSCLGDLVAAPGPREQPEDLLAIPGLLAALPATERTVVTLRFFQDLKQEEIAARIGYSQMHISRLLRRALDRMRTQLVEGPDDSDAAA